MVDLIPIFDVMADTSAEVPVEDVMFLDVILMVVRTGLFAFSALETKSLPLCCRPVPCFFSTGFIDVNKFPAGSIAPSTSLSMFSSSKRPLA